MSSENLSEFGGAIKTTLDSYLKDLPKPVYTFPSIIVLLTGSTGNIGSHVLASLLNEPRVQRVYTLNRPSSTAEDRQKATFIDRDLPVRLLGNGKLVQLSGVVTEDNFGLEPAVLDRVMSEVTHIIHSAWSIELSLPLADFSAQIAATRRFVDLCCGVGRPVKLFFTSSVTACHKWDVSLGPVPEKALPDPEVATVTGYGAAKYICEHILAKAAENGLQATVLRIGQVCGSSTTGAWGTYEWVPILIKSSVSVGIMPDLDGVLSWVPLDAVASVFTDLVVSNDSLPPLMNLTHPRPIAWRELFGYVNGALKTPLRVAPYDEWLAAVEAAAATGKPADIADVPAVALLEFFRFFRFMVAARAAETKAGIAEAGGVPPYATVLSQEYSSSLRALEKLNAAHAQAWIGYWRKKQFLE